MEIFLGLAVLVVLSYFLYLRIVGKPANTDLPEAGVQLDKPAEVPPPVTVSTVSTKSPEPVTITNPLDVNKDGKVDLADAKDAVKKTVAKVKSSTPRPKKKK